MSGMKMSLAAVKDCLAVLRWSASGEDYYQALRKEWAVQLGDSICALQ
jgi:hypothetical protein